MTRAKAMGRQEIVKRAETSVAQQDFQFFNAVFNGNTEYVEYRLRNGYPVTRKNELGYDMLLLAGDCGNLDMGKLAFRYGAPPNNTGSHRQATVHRSAINGHYRFLDLLARNGANFNMPDDCYMTPPMLAKAFNQPLAYFFMAEYGANAKMVTCRVEGKPVSAELSANALRKFYTHMRLGREAEAARVIPSSRKIEMRKTLCVRISGKMYNLSARLDDIISKPSVRDIDIEIPQAHVSLPASAIFDTVKWLLRKPEYSSYPNFLLTRAVWEKDIPLAWKAITIYGADVHHRAKLGTSGYRRSLMYIAKNITKEPEMVALLRQNQNFTPAAAPPS